jgi:hypothetical protein
MVNNKAREPQATVSFLQEKHGMHHCDGVLSLVAPCNDVGPVQVFVLRCFRWRSDNNKSQDSPGKNMTWTIAMECCHGCIFCFVLWPFPASSFCVCSSQTRQAEETKMRHGSCFPRGETTTTRGSDTSKHKYKHLHGKQRNERAEVSCFVVL